MIDEGGEYAMSPTQRRRDWRGRSGRAFLQARVAAPGGVVIGGGEDKRRITNGPALKKERGQGSCGGSVITGPGGPC